MCTHVATSTRVTAIVPVQSSRATASLWSMDMGGGGKNTKNAK
jgi:hypothetical protein